MANDTIFGKRKGFIVTYCLTWKTRNKTACSSQFSDGLNAYALQTELNSTEVA